MATLTIRHLDEMIKTHLRIRAAEHGHSIRGLLESGPEGGLNPFPTMSECPAKQAGTSRYSV